MLSCMFIYIYILYHLFIIGYIIHIYIYIFLHTIAHCMNPADACNSRRGSKIGSNALSQRAAT